MRSARGAGLVLLAAGALVAGCASGGHGNSGSGGSGPVTIKAVLPPNTGPITAADNAGLRKLTAEYEAAHKNVTVDWLPNNTTGITQANAAMESQASGGGAPNVVWEQYGPVTSGALPAGLLQNVKSYLGKPNPYVPGNDSWLSLFSPTTVPYMTSPNGDIDIILGSNVETGMFYSKTAFAKAKITSAPATWADFITDLGKLKSVGVHPPLPVHHRRPLQSVLVRAVGHVIPAREPGQPVQRQQGAGHQRPQRRGRNPQGHHQHDQPALCRGLEAARATGQDSRPAGKAPTTRARTRTPRRLR